MTDPNQPIDPEVTADAMSPEVEEQVVEDVWGAQHPVDARP